MIRFNSVSKIYDTNVFALRSLTTGINKGEFVFVTGSSGAGKSTLLKLLYGELKPSSGNISIHDKEVHSLSRSKLAYLRRQMGIIFQDFKLLWDRTVFDNVCLPLHIWGGNKDAAAKAERIMTELNIWRYKDLYPRQVSGGEQQKIAICRALIGEPWILIADEPTGNLDPASATEVFNIFNRIAKKGSTVIFATHNEHLMRLHNGRVMHLDKGKLVTA
ncbi:MAG: ATP-binding cassette domain-containing protein [Pseudomonadota bacterium]